MAASVQQTILLVEDTRELALVIARELEAAGYRVVQARDGQTALELHARERPDLVVLDWMLPRLSGIDVLREVRQTSATPVLMLTARGEEADRVIGLELGADDYLAKPFSMRELIARVRALLRRGALLRQALGSVLRWSKSLPRRWGGRSTSRASRARGAASPCAFLSLAKMRSG